MKKLNYIVAPEDWYYKQVNPFTKSSFSRKWSCLFILDREDDCLFNGTSEHGLYTLAVSKEYPLIDELVADFLRYETLYNRTVIVGSAYKLDLEKFIDECNNKIPEQMQLRDSDPKILVHSTLEDRWERIKKDNKLKSPSILKKEGIVYNYIGFTTLKEPDEYFDFIYFGSLEKSSSEVVILSHQQGEMVLDCDCEYNPGVRLYLDNYKMISNGIVVRDGLHIAKVKYELSLDDYLIDVVTENDCELYKRDAVWTPRRFQNAANEVFKKRNKI